MFCDLVGSTALASRLDPEDLREVIGEYHKDVATVVGRFDGFVAKYMGDGVLAYFGYPQAHEDDAERAVRAGLEIVTTARLVPAAPDGRLRVRVGIATGLVVVGDLVGAGEAHERGVVGETPNLAARLQALAEPGSVVIAAGTHKLTGGIFEYEELGKVELKGFVAPVAAWRVRGEGAVESRFEALHSAAALTPLVGREEEIELLLRRWTQAKEGEGRVVLLTGEPGIGKSRLSVALQERLRDEPHVRLRYFCSPYHQDSALHPTIVQLERAAGFERDDTPETKLHKLEALLAPTSSPIADVILLAELLHIPADDLYAPSQLNPQRKKEETFEALLRQLVALAQHQPVLMIYEDVHWIDPSSRELLDRVVDRVAGLPMLLLITFRPEFQPPWSRTVARDDARSQPTGPAAGRDARAAGRRQQGSARRYGGRDRHAHRWRAALCRGVDQSCFGGARGRRQRRRRARRGIHVSARSARDAARVPHGAARSARAGCQAGGADRSRHRP